MAHWGVSCQKKKGKNTSFKNGICFFGVNLLIDTSVSIIDWFIHTLLSNASSTVRYYLVQTALVNASLMLIVAQKYCEECGYQVAC